MADNEKDKSTDTEKFVDKLASGDNKTAGEALKDALRSKVGDTLDASRKEYASGLFNTARDVLTQTPGQVPAASHSDPKPEVASSFSATASQADVLNAMTPDGAANATPAETAPAETAPAEAPADSGEIKTGE